MIAELNLGVPIDIAQPVRQPRDMLLNEGGIENAIDLAAIRMAGNGAILVLIDSEVACPAELARNLLARATKARSDKRIFVVLAHHEFEAWFLASASSLAGYRQLSENMTDHPNPEGVQGCKEWLERWMPPRQNTQRLRTSPRLRRYSTFNSLAEHRLSTSCTGNSS